MAEFIQTNSGSSPFRCGGNESAVGKNDSFIERSIIYCGRKWSWPNVGKILAFDH
jgi:hypothetical protein